MKNFRTKVFKQAHELMRGICGMPVQGVGVVPPHQADAPGNSNIRLRESGWKLEKGERNVTGRSEPHQRYRSGKLQDRPLLRR